METSNAEVENALEYGQKLFEACLSADNFENAQKMVDAGYPTWYAEPESGWTCLHAACAVQDEQLVDYLLKHSAIWNAVDACGLTAGDVALSLNNPTCYRLIRDHGLRSEFILRALAKNEDNENMDDPDAPLVLKSKDDSAAGSSSTFLSSKLRYTHDENGQEICMATLEGGEEVGVMMGWETELMQETVKHLVADHPNGSDLHVLNIGFGLGIIDNLFQSQTPTHHTIIEPHPDVLAHMRLRGWYDKPHVTILEGKWQDFMEDEKLFACGGYDIIYTDTFSEEYKDLLEFFDHIPNLIRDPDSSRFSFFNGLGATNALFHDVYTNLAELHLTDIGLRASFVDVALHNLTPGQQDQPDGVWGETRKYFSLPLYRLPICVMD